MLLHLLPWQKSWGEISKLVDFVLLDTDKNAQTIIVHDSELAALQVSNMKLCIAIDDRWR